MMAISLLEDRLQLKLIPSLGIEERAHNSCTAVVFSAKQSFPKVIRVFQTILEEYISTGRKARI
jgi:hypothetical protein